MTENGWGGAVALHNFAPRLGRDNIYAIIQNTTLREGLAESGAFFYVSDTLLMLQNVTMELGAATFSGGAIAVHLSATEDACTYPILFQGTLRFRSNAARAGALIGCTTNAVPAVLCDDCVVEAEDNVGGYGMVLDKSPVFRSSSSCADALSWKLSFIDASLPPSLSLSSVACSSSFAPDATTSSSMIAKRICKSSSSLCGDAAQIAGPPRTLYLICDTQVFVQQQLTVNAMMTDILNNTVAGTKTPIMQSFVC